MVVFFDRFDVGFGMKVVNEKRAFFRVSNLSEVQVSDSCRRLVRHQPALDRIDLPRPLLGSRWTS